MRTSFLLLAGIVVFTGCGQPANPPGKVQSAAPPVADESRIAADGEPKKLAARHLPNPWLIHPKVISGGLPEGEAAFQELEDLGVKTVISVDGAVPDVELAKKHGMRYVHLPHGYDGVPDERVKELAKAVRDLPGPIYIHCHHGRHRSPAASAVACVAAGLIEPGLAETVLKAAGTSESYRGLYASAKDARRLDDKLLDELKAEFPEKAKLPPMAEEMVAVEHTHEHLKQVAAAGWKVPPDHPDIEPAHEALLLREHFTELLRTEAAKKEPPKFQELLRDSEAAAREIETGLVAWQKAGQAGAPSETITKAFDRVTANCKSCHTAFRDVPLKEKSK